MAKGTKQTEQACVKYALGLPGAHEDFPWGERVAKVKKKVFVFFGKPETSVFGMSVKLPESGSVVLELPFATPTGYGLGKSGWVSLQFGKRDSLPPVDVMCAWIEESYRAVAPRRLVDELEAGGKPARREPKKKKVARPRPGKKR
jgi:predicted DNA-binding protein (MmcQ/YjbR family)